MELKEQKLNDIKEAVKLYKQANELVDKANKLITRNIRGLRLIEGMPMLCGITANKAYRGKFDIHVSKGILKLAKALEVEAEPEKVWDGSLDNRRKVVVTEDVKFFQLGEPTQSRYCYK